jgi:Fe-S cluster biogenesis protein NfuA
VKLVVYPPLETPGSRDFVDPTEAREASPLAARLFALEGVRRVYVGSGFVTVTKDPAASWDALGRPLVRALEEHVRSGEAWIRPGFEAPEGAGAGRPNDGRIEARIRALLEREIRPLVRLDGGDVALESFSDGVVRVDLHGACAGCPSARATLAERIETRLREALPEVRSVVATGP